MCGICGILNNDPAEPVSEDLLKAMCNVIRHRGPDDEGAHIDGNVGIGVRRLSVIDVAGGRQPQRNEDGRCHIVFNGEIYNYAELRRTCQAKGHRFSSRSDTETILHLYEDLGLDCTLPLNGMFAFAIYDSRNQSLMLARDRLGIKPLYYADTGSHFVFGSEIKSLLAHPQVSREIDPIALDQYLAYKYIPGPRTIFKSVRQLPPGHILIWRNGHIQIRPYWKLSFASRAKVTEREAAEELTERVERAVKMQMVSDVPLGVLLSGGIDSSLIAATMSRLSSSPVKTFAIGFEERSYNELDAARQVADRLGTEHHELVVRPNVHDLFEQVVGHFDEPFGDSSAILTYLVSRLARERVTVALSGTGADELFAGYERYWATPLASAYHKFPRGFREAFEWGLRRLPDGHSKRGWAMRASRFTQSASAHPLCRHQSLIRLFSQAGRKALYAPECLHNLLQEGADPLDKRFAASDATSDLNRLLDLDTGTLLADDYLVKDDRMSMAASLELRVPFLDHTLVEFAASLPPNFKLRGLTTKYILRKASRNLLPRDVLRRPKRGFEIPLAHWIGGELRNYTQDLLLSPQAKSRGYFNPRAVEGLIESHTSGRKNHSRQIWALMVLEMWHRGHTDVLSLPQRSLHDEQTSLRRRPFDGA